MPVYSYIAIDESKKDRKGTIASDSPRQARQELREQGLSVSEITEHQPTSTAQGLSRWIPGQSIEASTASFIGELATLLSVGVPLLESIETLKPQYKGRFRNVLIHINDRVESGSGLAKAMSEHPQAFDRLSVSMAEVGENAGNLDETLSQLAQFKQRSLLFKDRVLSALLYPMIILSVSIGVSIFLMTVVIPMLLTNLVEAERPLPWPTMVLKFMSDTLLSYGWIMAIALAAVLLLVYLGLKTQQGKRLWDSMILRIPILGNLSRKQEISKTSLIISTLLKSGLEFVKAVDIAKGTTRNVLLREALTDCLAQVSSGKDIGRSIKQNDYFPPMVGQIFTIGQKSGRLDEMLGTLSQDYDRQVESATARLTATIEPVMILGLSIFVGFILFATILPILEAGNALQN